MPQASRLAAFRDMAPVEDAFLADVVKGLAGTPKTLPCKYIYDAEGSRLFERICELPEYYLTRTETALLAASGPEIAALAGPGVHIIELGCGSIRKARMLLDALEEPVGYVAVDISRDHLLQAAAELAADYPDIEVAGTCADFTGAFEVVPPKRAPKAKRIAFFPGSTLGNLDEVEAGRFLKRTARLVGPGGDLLIGLDLKKDPAVLHAAYNDADGVTAAFNLNLLKRINRELGADFDLGAFCHYAFYNPFEDRVEMHLVSLEDQTVRVGDESFRFRLGETIHTENSYKYTIAGFHDLAGRSDFLPIATWTDEENLFSVHYLRSTVR